MQTLGLADSTPKTQGRLRVLLWPRISNEIDAETAAHNAMWACLVLAILNAALALSVGPSSLLYAAVLAMLALGIRQFSISASITALILYVYGVIASMLLGQVGVGIVIGVIFTGLFSAALRSAVFMRRFRLNNPQLDGSRVGFTARIWWWTRPIALGLSGLILALATMATVFVRAFSVPTASMEPTIGFGDRIMVLRPAFTGPVRRGDLVAFSYPVDPRVVLAKRVLGLPGDRVHFEDKTLVLNGNAITEPYARHSDEYPDAFRDNFPSGSPEMMIERGQKMLRENLQNGEILVPRDSYFVLGDNRDNSLDSRYWGFISQSDIVGRPLYIYASPRPNRAGTWFIRYPVPQAKTLRTFFAPGSSAFNP